MTTTKYWLLLITGSVVIGLTSRYISQTDSEQNAQAFSSLAITCFIPLIAYFRMKYLKFTLKDMLISLVPFFGAKYRNRRLFGPDPE